MKINPKYKVRELAGELVVVVQGAYGADMTRIIALNNTSRYLWEALYDKEFDAQEVVRLLLERYEVEESVAKRDAEAWVTRLSECGVLL